MKKYESNKAKKLLLASMLIPMVITAVPLENVYASEVPTLKVYDLNGSPKLEWATEMLNENILQQINFENETFNSSNFKITNENSYEGNNSLKVLKTYDENGYYGNLGSGSQSLYDFKKPFKFKNNDNLSVSLKAKNINAKQAYLQFQTVGDLINKAHTYSSLINNSTLITFKENVNIGQNYFYVNNPTIFEELIKLRSYVALDKNSNGNYGIGQIIDFNKDTGKVTLHDTFKESFNSGEEVLAALWTNPILFQGREISNNEWTTYNFNQIVSNKNFNFDTRSVIFEILTSTNGEFLIDDIKIGYATEVEVYREGQSIYRGYLSDFHDTRITDKIGPNKVDNITTQFSNNQLQFNWLKPTDNGVTTNYAIQSIAKNGNRSALSSPQDVTIKSNVSSYRYSISKNKKDTPTTTVSANEFSLPINQLNLINDYLHIQAIDSNGNVSEISHFKVIDLVTDDVLKDIYDRLDELEHSKDYNDFQDFIDDVENMFGGHLPQDIINRIEDLGKYHGLNTLFLLLEQGEFTLQTSDVKTFGQATLTAAKQTLKTGFEEAFGVIDARGTQDGWKITVTASPFVEDTFDGFVGNPNQLPLGSLALKAPNHIERVGKVHKQDGLPITQISDYTVIDNGAVTLLSANKGEGLGQFKYSFDDESLALTVDATTAKIDNKNYPVGVTPYSSTITWDLITGP